MKNAIKEYLNLTEDEKRDLWKNAMFVFDTNIFLNLYRYTNDTRNSLLNAMQQLSDRIWMPKQVAQELMKDRVKVIFETLHIFNEIDAEKEKFIKYCKEKLRRENSDTIIESMSKEIDKHIERLKSESNYIDSVEKDIILSQLLQLYDNKVGIGFNVEDIESIKKEGDTRYSKLIPPGYKDYKKGENNNAFGDLIIWKEILSFARNEKKDIIYVTADKKEDWWEKVNGQTLGPRVELKKEFFEETKQKFNMYTMERFLTEFKDAQGTQIQQSAIDEVENYERFIDNQKYHIKNSYKLPLHMIDELNQEKCVLSATFTKLCNEQTELESRIKNIKDFLNFKEGQKYDTLFHELKEIQEELDRIKSEKDNIEKELTVLNWKSKELTKSFMNRRTRI